MRQLLIGLFIGTLTLSAATPRAAVAQDMQMKKCLKCGQTSLTAQNKCLVCGTPYGTPAPKAKAKETPAKAKAVPAKAKPAAEPAKAKQKTAPVKTPAKTIAPKPTPIAKSKAKPAVAARPAKSAPITKTPPLPKISPTVTVELPANPYETGLVDVPVKAVARNAPRLVSLEIKYAVAGKEATLPNRREGGAVKPPITAVAESVLKLENPGAEYRVWAVGQEGAMTITSEPVIVKRNPQTLPKLASVGAFEAYVVESGKERMLNASDPALPVGQYAIKFYVPSRAKPTMVSKPVEVQVGAAGRLSSAVSQVALDSLNGLVHVIVMRQGAPVNSATVQLASMADPQKTFALANGADGLYRFSDVPVGKYRVTVNQKPRQDVEVTTATAPTAVTVNLAPSTLAARAELDNGVEIPGIEFQSIGKAGRPLLLSSKAQEVEPGNYTVFLNPNEMQWESSPPQPKMKSVTVAEEESASTIMRLRRRRESFAVRVATDEPPPAATLSLRPKGPGWVGAQVRSLNDLKTQAQGQLQVGEYDVVFAESEKDEWEPAALPVQPGRPGEVTLRRRLGALTIALQVKSDATTLNEKDLRFELRKPDGTMRSVPSGTMLLPRGSYEVSVDPKSVPKGWRVAEASAAKSARVPVDLRVLFTLEPNSASLTLQKLLPKKKFLVQVDDEKARLLDAGERGEINVAITPGVHTIHVASLEYAFLDFVKKVQAPEQAALAVNFVVDEGEVSIGRGEALPPRRARIEVTLDLPADEAWARYVKDQGVKLPKKVDASYSRDGRLLLPANLGLPPAPYRATIAWSEERSVLKTEVGVGGKQERKFDVAKRAVTAKGEVVWKMTK